MNGYRRLLPAVYHQCDATDRYYDRETWPLCWNVKIHQSASFEMVWRKMCTPDFEFINEAEALTIIPSLKALEKRWTGIEQTMYDRAVADMRESFLTSDTYNFVSPAKEKKYGVEFPIKGAECKWGFMGRSGGWLVLREFMGRPISNEHSHSWDDAKPDIYLTDNWRLPYLLTMMEEAHDAVEGRFAELIHQLAFHMRYNVLNGMLDE